jgi:hypothetical protein
MKKPTEVAAKSRKTRASIKELQRRLSIINEMQRRLGEVVVRAKQT